jgi:hypothetical protein
MKINRKRWMKVTSVLALGVFLMASVAGVSAQEGRNRQRRHERREERREAKRGLGKPNWGGSAQLRQTALNAGYNNGIVAGRNDHQRGEQFNFTDESDYHSAMKDYSSSLGDRTLYQRYFRAAFENGYRDGWNGY